MTFGIVGLSLFCGVFACAGWGVCAGLRRAEPDGELSVLGRALLTTLAGVMVMIFTLSSIGVVPWVYWTLAGLCVGYAQLAPEPQPVLAQAPVGGIRAHA